MNGALQVWWIPQIPGKPFTVRVKDTDQAILLLTTLAAYDMFQYQNRIKPDYCNAGGLSVFEDGEWTDWYNDDGQSIDDLIEEINK